MSDDICVSAAAIAVVAGVAYMYGVTDYLPPLPRWPPPPIRMPHGAWLPATNAPPPWLASQWRAERLDRNGFMFRLPNFLSLAECEHVLENVVPVAGFHMQPQDGLVRSTSLAGANLLEPAETKRHQAAANWSAQAGLGEGPDAVLANLEQRIARLTGIPFHDDESPLMLGITSPPGGGRLADANQRQQRQQQQQQLGGQHVRGLHHDHNQRERRTCTVVMYLHAREDGLEGGGTVFPCVPRASADAQREGHAAAAAPPEACESVDAHYRAGHYSLTHCDEEDGKSAGGGHTCMSEALSQRVRRQCVGTSAAAAAQADATDGRGGDVSDGHGVLMEPLLRGDAVLFLSVLPEDGTVLPNMYHTGCPVDSASRTEKVTLQKFKEVHPPTRRRSPQQARARQTK